MRGEGGFTLVEVLLAALLVVLAVLGVAAMSVAATSALGRSAEHTTAVALSHQRIEWLRNQGYASAVLNAGTVTETLTGPHLGFTRATTVVDDVPRTGVKRITVVTTGPGLQTVEITALLAGP